MDLAVVYPVYNEVEILEETAEKTVQFLRNHDLNFSVVYVTDGSTDGTQDEADRLAEEVPEVSHLEYGDRLGKGKAFERAFNEVDARKFAYCDADLSTELKHLEDLNGHLENGFSIVAGSRRLGPGFDRGPLREIPSIFFNELLRIVFGSGIRDHQCGFKGFRKEEKVQNLFKEVDSRHWFWDAEMLIRAQRKGIKIKEFPVEWSEASESKVNVFRDSLYFLKKTAELRVKLWKK